jgi:hypothetical protein
VQVLKALKIKAIKITDYFREVFCMGVKRGLYVQQRPNIDDGE